MVTRRQEDKEKRRQEILQAAAQLYATRGVENVTFADVAEKARLSRSLIYFYFPDPQTLLLSTVLDSCQQLHMRFLSTLDASKSGREQVELFGRAYVQYQQEMPSCFTLLALHEARLGTPHPVEASIKFHKQAIMNIVAEGIRRGIKDGSITGSLPDPTILAYCLWAFAHGLAQVANTKGDALKETNLTPEDVLDAGFTFLRRGLRR